MARLNAWFSPAATDKAVAGDYSGIYDELPGVVFDKSDKGTIISTLFSRRGSLALYDIKGLDGKTALDKFGYRIVGFYHGAGYNGGDRMWLEYDPARDKNVDPIYGTPKPYSNELDVFHVDQYRTEKRNVTMDIVEGIAFVATAGVGFEAIGAYAAAQPAASTAASAATAAQIGGASAPTASGGLTLAQAGQYASSALSAVGTVAKGIGQAAGAVGAVAGAIGTVQAINGTSSKPGAPQGAQQNTGQLTGSGIGGILNSASPYLLFGGLIISIALLAKGK